MDINLLVSFMDKEFAWVLSRIAEGKFDVIIPIKRKGYAVYKRILQLNVVPGLEEIKVLDNEHFDENEVKGQRVAVFDDSTHTGSTLLPIINKLEKWNVVYEIFTLLRSEECKLKTNSKYVVGKLDNLRWMKMRSDYYFHLGAPLDPDHLVMSCSLTGSSETCSATSLNTSLSESYYVQEISETKGLEMLTIEIPPAEFFRNVEWSLPDFVERIDASKVRLYFDKGKVKIVPIMNPVIICENSNQCRRDLPICLLDSHKLDETSNIDRQICRDCVAINCTLELASIFYKRLTKEDLNNSCSIPVEKISWEEMTLRYKEFQAELDAFLSDNLGANG